MAIEFHCDHCDKLIRTDDANGGQHGKCPACKQRVYIPTADAEPLDLIPVDEAEERAARKRDQQSKAMADALLTAGDGADGGAAGAAASAAGAARPAPPVDVDRLVAEFAISMFEGELEEAQQIKTQLAASKSQVAEAVQRMVADEIPPDALSHIPRPVLIGFLKQL